MTQQIEHTPPPAAILSEGSILSPVRAEVLALCTIDVETAVALLRRTRGRGAVTNAIRWLEFSYLMRKVEGAWRLTATGDMALRSTFRAVMLGWPRCHACKRLQRPEEFLSTRGVSGCANCRNCRSLAWQWGRS